MPKDGLKATEIELNDLTAEELAKLESRLFCAGGPPQKLDLVMLTPMVLGRKKS